MKSSKVIIIVGVIVFLCDCTPKVMRTWSTTEEYDRRFQNVLVMGLVNKVDIRNNAEIAVVQAGRKAGVNSGTSMAMFPPELGKPFEDVERAKFRMREKGYDGILTVTIININAARYIPPEVRYEPLVYYDRFRNYYFRTYELVYRSGYFAQHSRYFIETNFYELKGGYLVWSGRSTVFEYYDFEPFLTKYARSLFKELKEQGVIFAN